MLFKPSHVPMILSGNKTRTRRLWKSPRVKVGNLYKAKTRMISKDSFATLRVLAVSRETLRASEARADRDLDAKAEGYETWEGFKDIWMEINGVWNPDDEPYIIDFEVVR